MNWEEVKVNAAIAAMQANLSNPDLLQAITASEVVTRTCAEKCAKVSVRYAEALVEELKKSVGTESDGAMLVQESTKGRPGSIDLMIDDFKCWRKM